MKSLYQEYPDSFYIEPVKETIGSDGACYHIHDKYEISLCLDGQIFIYSNGYKTRLTSPCLILHRPYTVHFVDAAKDKIYRRRNIYFEQDFIDRFDKNVADVNAVFVSDFGAYALNETQTRRLCLFMEYLYAKENTHLRPLLFCTMLKEIEHITTESVKPENKRYIYICDVIRHICRNYMYKLDTAELAKLFFVSQTKLNRDFRSYTQTTILQFTTRIRLKNALRLIMSGSPVAEAAHKCGIQNESSFIRTFKSFYGTTPYQYVKQTKTN